MIGHLVQMNGFWPMSDRYIDPCRPLNDEKVEPHDAMKRCMCICKFTPTALISGMASM